VRRDLKQFEGGGVSRIDILMRGPKAGRVTRKGRRVLHRKDRVGERGKNLGKGKQGGWTKEKNPPRKRGEGKNTDCAGPKKVWAN